MHLTDWIFEVQVARHYKILFGGKEQKKAREIFPGFLINKN